MATVYIAAYAGSTGVTGDGGTRVYSQPASSGDSVTNGALLAYDGTLTTAKLQKIIRALQDQLGLPK